MYRPKFLLTFLLISAMQLTVAKAGSPMPLHTIEGNSGVFITGTA